MQEVFLTRRERFSGAHKLYVSHWSKEQNEEMFGKCANANFHGHNYELFVTVAGQPDPVTGFVINATDLKSIIHEYVIDHLDHANLNLDIDWFQNDLQPTTENLIIAIWDRLEAHLKGCRLHKLRLVETENISVEYFGPTHS